ncbi:ssDNA-binding protein [Corynebacterium humireducens NBRC 106098 = DSM 45392]|uniref:Single-stranded DNA-binding protein n=1 Tax=Corynebacterium humireducens NBRC 106098 = DSM 45392 TaxID=1223515 RepID=A0A0B5D8I7_9CORY|nr:single-stranded DNA-binding protein [Corynebacterium humireducens]AJE32543.1 ssDNA-binding protein [Corynebacterium humireducens NBRC 106098 = DSM 45392]
MAHTTIIGHLGKDPELHQSTTGTIYTRLSLAWSERYKDRTGTYIDGPTTWISITVFGRQAENAVDSLRKGHQIIATGNMRTEIWASDHGEQPIVTMIADTISPALFTQVVDIHRDDHDKPPTTPDDTDTPPF